MNFNRAIYWIAGVIAMLIVVTAGCSKDLKAGDPLPLIYKNVYLVGDATPAGWTIDSAKAMTRSADNTNVFIWTGPLTAGEIKFPTARSWSSDTFMASAAGQPVTNNKAQLALNGNPDLHWKLTGAEAGTYKITLDTQNSTVSFEKIQN